jgi:perosamine synthetase
VIVPVSRPYVGQAEIEFVNEALRANAISGAFGSFLDRFESDFAEFCGTKYAVACSNGTTALHLSLVAAGIKSGDEVLVSTLTNMATFFAVLYIGAKPVAVDVSLDTLTMDPEDLARKITERSKGIMVVHLFGHPTDMDPVNQLARKHGLLVFEDCAEAHGALYKGRKVGGLGIAGAFSFYANKIITSGEGGMVTTDDIDVARRARSLRALAFGTENKFMHEAVGYNYRMTNIQAAIGCGQMLVADKLVEKRREIAAFYNARFQEFERYLALPREMPWAKNVIWMYHLRLLGPLENRRAEIMSALASAGVETREGFIPCNLQEIFIRQGWTQKGDCPVANQVAYTSFYLPTGPSMTTEELEYVATNFIAIIKKFGSSGNRVGDFGAF